MRGTDLTPTVLTDPLKVVVAILAWIPFVLFLFFITTERLGLAMVLFLVGWTVGAGNLAKARLVVCPQCHLHHPTPMWKKSGELTCKGCQCFVTYEGKIVTKREGAQPVLIALDKLDTIQWPPGCIICGGEFTRLSDFDLGNHKSLSIPVCDEHSHKDLRVEYTWDSIQLGLSSPKVAAQFRILNDF